MPRRLYRRFGSLSAPGTFPSRLPLLALDRIWVDPKDRLLSLAHHRHTPAQTAADQLLLVAGVAI